MIDLSNIRKLRQKLGLSQSKLAKKAGITQAHIAKIESGKVDPRFSTVNKIFDCLEKEQKISCADYATKTIVNIDANKSAFEAAQLMRKKGISQMPVFQGNKIIGLLTESSVIKNSGLDFKKIKVKDIMEDSPPVVSKFTSIDAVKSLLLEFSAVIVTDKDKIIGIITKSNLLK